MRRGQPGNPYKTALAALKADVVGWQRQITATEALIADLTVRAEGGTRGTALGPVHDVPPTVKRRRRRRHGARNGVSVPRKSGTVPRRNAQIHRRKRPKPDVIEPVQVAAPVKAVRGAAQFAVQLEELEKIRVGIAAGANSKAAHALRVRGDAVLREMAGKAKLPDWCDKATRVRWRRAAERPETVPRAKKPRKVTPPPVPPVKLDSGWHDDGNGVLSREIATK